MTDPVSEISRKMLLARQRYARRAQGADWRYHPLSPALWQSIHERQRTMSQPFHRLGWQNLSRVKLLEVSSGVGGIRLELLRFGFDPSNLQGVEQLPEERHAQARHVLSAALRLICGDTCEAPSASQDIVLQSTVFSSLLDDAFQQRLADAMWRWVKPAAACSGTTS